MKKGPIRTLIPVAYTDLKKWAAPDYLCLNDIDQELYLARKQAVEMYAANFPFKTILEKSYLSRSEVRRLVIRCVEADGYGYIHGFRALVPGYRTKGYTRKAQVNHVPSKDKGGCAGALQQLLEKHPEVAEFIETHLFKRASEKSVHEARISYVDLHKQWRKRLQELGVKSNEWPFNTKSYGYNALRSYCQTLWEKRFEYGMKARAGDDAARKTGIGEGYLSILPVFRPYSYVQLDFHKVDAASVIIFKNRYGEEIEVPVTRWHIGLLIDEHPKSIIGFYVSLEMTPSGDCVLETIESALKPDCGQNDNTHVEIQEGGKILINQVLPELAYQGFSALKMDNAWSNTATEVVNNIMDTVGCAVNFGPVKAWWTRAVIERIFGTLTRKGMQRLVSTYGNGPLDTRKSDPAGKAIQFRILISELVAIISQTIREYNESSTEGLQGSSPVSVLKNALLHPSSGFFLQTLPKQTQNDMRLMKHVQECTVRGNIKKNVRPYFKSDRCTYTNPVLGRSYHLVNKKLVVYIDRRDCRIAYATVKETGEQLGLMIPEKRWRQTKCSIRARKLINSTTLSKRLQSVGEDAVATWGENKKQELFQRRRANSKRTRKTTSSQALQLARTLASQPPSNFQQTVDVNQPKHSLSQLETRPYTAPEDPFGVGRLPTLHQIRGR